MISLRGSRKAESDREIVGYILYNLTPIVSPFLARGFNKAVTEVTGLRVNHAGYGSIKLCQSSNSRWRGKHTVVL